MHTRLEEWPLVYQDASTAPSLVAQLVPRFLDNSDKPYLLVEIAGVAGDCGAAALIMGKPPWEAIQLLELGLGARPWSNHGFYQ